MNKHLFSLICTLVALAAFSACGRSALDSYPPPQDSGLSDADVLDAGPTCDASTCPSGCCDERGQCRAGTAREACGTFAGACSDCPREGFPACDGQTRTCARPVEVCDAETCADGCCSLINGNPVCLRGDQPGACGRGGAACQDCGDAGLSCNAATGVCEGQPCNSETCPDGCCLGNECRVGTDDTTCGGGGFECENCQATGRECIDDPQGGGGGICSGAASCNANNCSGCCLGDVCLPGGDTTACGTGAAMCMGCGNGEVCNGGQCVPGDCAASCPGGCCRNNVCMPGTGDSACGKGGEACTDCLEISQAQSVCVAQACAPVACNATTCPDGCCDGDVCRVGENSACGTLGGVCSNCAATGQVCEVGVCVDTCTAQNCLGCCNGNLCEAGFLNDSCGSGGGACTNCNAQGESCDIDSLPRTCEAGSTCPGAYAACPAAVRTQPLQPESSCGATLLNQAAAACASGPNTSGCQNFFAQLQAQPATAACASCLSPFRYTFAAAHGIAACAASFASDNCNRSTGCAFDCEDESCDDCGAGSAGACRQNVRVGQCRSHVQSSLVCLASTVLLNQNARFCSPDQYNGVYGDWLRGVGNHYCAAP